MSKRMRILFFCLFILVGVVPSSFAVDDKCAACKAVAEELEIELSSERPRNHLDMRHRLDSKGQRQGKLIDYRYLYMPSSTSITRICFDSFIMIKWKILKNCIYILVLASLTSAIFPYKQEARAYSKDISSYCGRLLEETEDELAELIKKGSVKVGGVSKVLCQDLSKHCSQMSVSHAAEVDDDGHDGEL
ncbi:hypothetical protein Fmac_000166 [Flemingia macrophylla]|uniref:DUF3456 domain-containing protein n=1 Tax=Flemingia macrophylla TaxID=520843 RepID=A0ABD1NDH2_9FABA